MSDDDEFRRAMAQAGVRPLPAGPAAGPEIVFRSRPPKLAGRSLPTRGHVGRFDIERYGERVEGLVEGGDPRQLNRLHRGDLHIDATLDLHGHSENAARRQVEELVERAYGAGKTCLRVIHGRGHRSSGAPVLKEALPEWLTGPRCAARVLAFVSAPPELGGAGATLVLLRRKR